MEPVKPQQTVHQEQLQWSHKPKFFLEIRQQDRMPESGQNDEEDVANFLTDSMAAFRAESGQCKTNCFVKNS